MQAVNHNIGFGHAFPSSVGWINANQGNYRRFIIQIAIFNIKDASKYKERIEKEMSERKKARAQLTKLKEKKA